MTALFGYLCHILVYLYGFQYYYTLLGSFPQFWFYYYIHLLVYTASSLLGKLYSILDSRAACATPFSSLPRLLLPSESEGESRVLEGDRALTISFSGVAVDFIANWD